MQEFVVDWDGDGRRYAGVPTIFQSGQFRLGKCNGKFEYGAPKARCKHTAAEFQIWITLVSIKGFYDR